MITERALLWAVGAIVASAVTIASPFLFKVGQWCYVNGRALVVQIDRVEANQTEMRGDIAGLVEGARVIASDLAEVRKLSDFNGGQSNRDMVFALLADMQLNDQITAITSDRAIIKWKPDRSGIMRPVYVTAFFSELTGMSREDVEHRGWVEIVAPEDRQRIAQARERCRQYNEVLDETFVMLRPDHVHRVKARVWAEPTISRVDGKTNVGWIFEVTPEWPEFVEETP